MTPEDLAAVRTTSELIKAARQNLDRNDWDYVIGGGESETTLLRNRQSLDEIAFRPRVLNDVGSISLRRDILGAEARLPIFLAPIGGLNRLVPEGATAPLRAAQTFGVPGILSSVTQPEFGEIRSQVSSPLIYQIYIHGDEAWVNDRLDAVTEAGYTAFCVTVDTAQYGRRERDLIKHYNPRAHNRAVRREAPHQSSFDWSCLARLRERCRIPFVLKGVATAEDAKLAVDHGIDVVYVSNHGGRQLDHGRGAIEVLPEVVDAVSGRAVVYMDGGIMRGTDVLKAIALGADAVGIGKLYALALSGAGEDGVVKMLELIEEEMLNAMANLGASDLGQLSASHLHPANAVRPPGVFSAFPLIDIADPPY
ncbi:MAG: alpha-hydroxy acid oxidase [Rhodospirillales bacterium]|nr:alpha-hydroxy acid oxidase [Rhodospirillales bacterium]